MFATLAKVLATSKLPGIELTMIFNRDVARKRTSDAAKYVPASVVWTENFDDVVNSKADIVVESTAQPADRTTEQVIEALRSHLHAGQARTPA